MKIRYLKETDDRYAISKVYEESWKYAYKDIVPQIFLNSIKEGEWVSGLDTKGRYTMIMEDGKNIIGTTSFCKSRIDEMSDFGEIISIYFLPEYTGRGYGKLLLGTVIDELKNMGYEKNFLWVFEDNYNARHFYENFGFKKSGWHVESSIGGKCLKEVQYCYGI